MMMMMMMSSNMGSVHSPKTQNFGFHMIHAAEKQMQKLAEDGARASKGKPKAEVKGPKNSRRKAFITLSYIVVAYVVCWVPFQFVFDVSLAKPEAIFGENRKLYPLKTRSYFRSKPEAISGDLYTAMFWLAYINSGLNPFMYAFSSADFRRAVVQIMKCRFCKQ